MDLGEPVFGRIRLCDILGSRPAMNEFVVMLDGECGLLLGQVRTCPAGELGRLRDEYIEMIRHVTSRPGSMALPQGKIRLFERACRRCIEAIDVRLGKRG